MIPVTARGQHISHPPLSVHPLLSLVSLIIAYNQRKKKRVVEITTTYRCLQEIGALGRVTFVDLEELKFLSEKGSKDL